MSSGPLISSNLSWRSMRFGQIRGEGLGTTMSEDIVAPPWTDIVKEERVYALWTPESGAQRNVCPSH